MALIFHPSSDEPALDIITRALDLDPNATLELTAKNLIIRFSNRTIAESWKAERDKSNLPTKWFSSRYQQKDSFSSRQKESVSSEDFVRLQNQVEYLTQEVLKMSMKPEPTKEEAVVKEDVEVVEEEVVEEVKPKKGRGRPKKV